MDGTLKSASRVEEQSEFRKKLDAVKEKYSSLGEKYSCLEQKKTYFSGTDVHLSEDQTR